MDSPDRRPERPRETLSRRKTHHAHHSTHYIQIKRPRLVINAIRSIIKRIDDAKACERVDGTTLGAFGPAATRAYRCRQRLPCSSTPERMEQRGQRRRHGHRPQPDTPLRRSPAPAVIEHQRCRLAAAVSKQRSRIERPREVRAPESARPQRGRTSRPPGTSQIVKSAAGVRQSARGREGGGSARSPNCSPSIAQTGRPVWLHGIGSPRSRSCNITSVFRIALGLISPVCR
jgi:hypothetical protein